MIGLTHFNLTNKLTKTIRKTPLYLPSPLASP
jgi:hypothetical protein